MSSRQARIAGLAFVSMLALPWALAVGIAVEPYTGDGSRQVGAAVNGPAMAAEGAKFRWRWEKIPGPGEHPWTTMWRSSQSGAFCDHTGEGKFCGCSNTSPCGQYDNGQQITTAPYGCDRPERWRLRCKAELEGR
jgi:hypothetical protein